MVQRKWFLNGFELLDDVVEIVQNWSIVSNNGFLKYDDPPTRIVFQMGGFICGTKNGNDQQNDFIS